MDVTSCLLQRHNKQTLTCKPQQVTVCPSNTVRHTLTSLSNTCADSQAFWTGPSGNGDQFGLEGNFALFILPRQLTAQWLNVRTSCMWYTWIKYVADVNYFMGISWFLEGTAGNQFSPTEYRGGGGGGDVENWLSINCWWRNQINSIKTQSRFPLPRR